MKVLITGGAGFIGSRTARRLADAGHHVTVLDNLSPQIHGVDPAQSPTFVAASACADFVRGDVRDRDLIFDMAPKFDAVLHLAAETGTGQSMYDATNYSDVNVVGTAVLLDALVRPERRVKRLVIASSRSVYGEGAYLCPTHGEVYPVERDLTAMRSGRFDPHCKQCGQTMRAMPTAENAPVLPASVYAVTKLAQEQMIHAVGRATGISTVSLRYQNVYGAGQSLRNPYTGILSIFSREMLADRPVEVFEDGEESRDFVHVEDVARANVLALTVDVATPLTANIGTGEATSVNALVAQLSGNLGFTGDVTISGRFRSGDIRHNFADIALARQALGWAPTISFQDGVREFCDWVRQTIRSDEAVSGYRASLDELEKRGMIIGAEPT